THGAAADDGQRGVDVDAAGARGEEEPAFEVLQVVDGERVEPLAVDGEDPLRQEPGVEGEQTARVLRRGIDVTLLVTDDERVSIENVDLTDGHRSWSFLVFRPEAAFVFRPAAAWAAAVRAAAADA